jgi:hypothetical protein
MGCPKTGAEKNNARFVKPLNFPQLLQKIIMRFAVLVLLILSITSSCGKRQANLATDESAAPDVFIESFPALELPFSMTQSSIAKSPGDSFLINPKLLGSFVPDSVFRRDFRRNDKLRFHAIGRVSEKKGETYLFVRAASASRTQAFLLVYDADNNFKVSMPVIRGNDRRRTDEFVMDKRFGLSVIHTRKGREGQQLFTKEVYVYNTAGVFTLVMTESNEVVEQEEVYDPIDTLRATHPLSGNYIISKTDFVTVRDGKSSNRLQFFIHMEKSGGDCFGELRGEMDVVKPGVAHYNKADDHCVLEFSFKGNTLVLRELEACGNHRSVRCVFSGTYRKKKMAVRK